MPVVLPPGVPLASVIEARTTLGGWLETRRTQSTLVLAAVIVMLSAGAADQVSAAEAGTGQQIR